jgi:hypothetical protein
MLGGIEEENNLAEPELVGHTERKKPLRKDRISALGQLLVGN